MRVVLVPVGSRGDVQPLCALGSSLRQRGHDVVLRAPPGFTDLARSFDLEYQPLGTDTRAYITEHADDCGGGLVRATARVNRHLFDVLSEQFRELPDAIAGSDLVIGAGLQVAAPSVARAVGVPYRYVVYCPALLQSRAHTPMLLPFETTLPWWANAVLWRLLRAGYGLTLGRRINRERSALGLPPVDDLYRHVVTPRPLLATDPELGAAPIDCDPVPAQVGYLHVRQNASLSPELVRFLAAGPAPIYVGFGSMTCSDPASTTAAIVGAARRLGCRLLISRGWAGLAAESLPGDVFAIDDSPHELLFPRCEAVVHHGGAGTTAIAARAGVPQLIVPHLADQPYWGQQVARLGVGASPIPRRRLTADSLASALGHVVGNAFMRRRAEELGHRLRGRDSLGGAVDELCGVGATRRRRRVSGTW